MRTAEFKKLLLFQLAGRGSFFGSCFIQNGQLFRFSHSSGKRDCDGCFERVFKSPTGEKRTLTWKQMRKIDFAPTLTLQEAISRWNSR